MVLVCKTRALETETLEAMRRAMQTGDLDASRLERSLARITAVKQRFVQPYQPVDTGAVSRTVGIRAHYDILAQIRDSVRI